jgi:hypothetical protein
LMFVLLFRIASCICITRWSVIGQVLWHWIRWLFIWGREHYVFSYLSTAFVDSLSIWGSGDFFALFSIWIGWWDDRETFCRQRTSPSCR